MNYSPLNFGQVIVPSDEICLEVFEATRCTDENKAKGLLCEFAHSLEFKRAGLDIVRFEVWQPFDRLFNGTWQDDKTSLLRKNGSPSPTHTISHGELLAWKRQPEVIIHSFEEVEAEFVAFRYMGPISFRKLVSYDLLIDSQFDSTFFFNRQKAYEVARP